MEYKDYYKILGVPKTATQDEIKTAFRKQARKFHPDLNPDNAEAEAKFKEANEAYEVLGNEENRQKYDNIGSNWKQFYQAPKQPPNYGTGRSTGEPDIDPDKFGERFSSIFDDLGDMSDFFKTFFGGNRSNGGNGANQEPVIQATLALTLEDVYKGGVRTLNLRGKEFKVNLKPGLKDGDSLRVKGQADTPGGGDVKLTIKVDPHPVFTRKASDLYCNVTIDPVTAVLGGQINVPTLNGSVKVKVPAGSQHDSQLRLRDKGMPIFNSPGHFGSLYVKLKIAIPKDLSAQEKELYEKLAALK